MHTLIPSLLLASLLSPCDSTAAAPPLHDEPPRARELIEQLKLSYLEGESGYFGVIGRSAQIVEQQGRSFAAHSRIYYLLTARLPTNFLHWLASDDTHVLVEGGPVDYFIFHPDGRSEKITLGSDFPGSHQVLVTAPGGSWKALRLHPGATHALLVNVLAPEWTPDRVRIGVDSDWVQRTVGSASWANEQLLRELVGPNLHPPASP